MDYNGIEVLLRAIMSIEFQTQFSVISGFRMFATALQESEILSKLIATADGNRERTTLIRDAILGLLDKNIDPNYQHPDDIPIACLFYVLRQTNLALASEVAMRIVEKGDNLFWAFRLVELHITGYDN